VIKNVTIVARIKVFEAKLKADGYFAEEAYMKDYEAEVASGKKPFFHADLSQLDAIAVADKLKERKKKWYEDTFKKWKQLCHTNFELLKKEDQAAVVDFCPQADRVRNFKFRSALTLAGKVTSLLSTWIFL